MMDVTLHKQVFRRGLPEERSEWLLWAQGCVSRFKTHEDVLAFASRMGITMPAPVVVREPAKPVHRLRKARF